ncbi:unnamed protein product [Rhizophagus irregularis]|nr:unnamed protein product [Rhizophagus irregularis]
MSEYYHGYTSICSYIRNRNETCSFIDLYQEMIIHSPPNTDDWSGLETAWKMRFLRSVKDIIPEKYDDIHSKGIRTKILLNPREIDTDASSPNERLKSDSCLSVNQSGKSSLFRKRIKNLRNKLTPRWTRSMFFSKSLTNGMQ